MLQVDRVVIVATGYPYRHVPGYAPPKSGNFAVYPDDRYVYVYVLDRSPIATSSDHCLTVLDSIIYSYQLRYSDQLLRC
jgi:hypothetical protein